MTRGMARPDPTPTTKAKAMRDIQAAFGYTVMARMSLLIGRLSDLIDYSHPEYGRATWWLLAVTIATLIAFRARRRGTEPPQ